MRAAADHEVHGAEQKPFTCSVLIDCACAQEFLHPVAALGAEGLFQKALLAGALGAELMAVANFLWLVRSPWWNDSEDERACPLVGE